MKFNKCKVFVLCALLSLSMCSCGKAQVSDAGNGSSAESVPSYNIETIFNDLCGKITFADTMEIVTDDYSEMLLSISPENYSDCILYMGSGATAEEFLIFQTDSREQSEQVVSALKTHLEDQKAAFESYDPEELKILGESYIASSDTLVFCLVSQDTNAVKTYIDSYLK